MDHPSHTTVARSTSKVSLLLSASCLCPVQREELWEPFSGVLAWAGWINDWLVQTFNRSVLPIVYARKLT
jgi:hypothetical protein